MKNFKLLLGATALLSTSLAMGVLADDEPSTTLNVSVEFLTPDMITPLQHIDFGKLVIKGNLGNQITMDPATGKITDFDSYYIFGKQKNGQVSIAYDETSSSIRTIKLDDNITLNSSEGWTIQFTPSFVELYSDSHGPLHVKTYGIGGTLNTSSGVRSSKYSGELTVTAIANQ